MIEMNAFQFEWPWIFWLLPLPLLVRLLPPRESQSSALRIPFMERLPASEGFVRDARMKWNPSLLLAFIIWILLLGAASRPQWVGETIELPVSGRSVMLAVDLSGSMEETDLELGGQPVTRLQVVKSVLKPFIQRREGDRLGLILFGDQAYLQTPLTFDRKTLSQMLEEAELGLAGEKTAIGDAIGLAVKRMLELSEEEKVLVLLTDGRNTAGSIAPSKAADLAAKAGLKIHSIGVGADEMWIRSLFGNRKVNPSAELDEKMLIDLSQATGGQYFRARSTAELEKVYRLIDKLEPVEQDRESYRPLNALFPWPLGASLFLVFLWTLRLMIKRSGGLVRPVSIINPKPEKMAA